MPLESMLAGPQKKPSASWYPVYLKLRDSIVGHRLPPGRKLPEDEIASICSVGRSVLRAALQALAHDGLVTLEPNRGAFVAKPTLREAREVFEARALIEPKVAALAAARADEQSIAALRAHLALEHTALQAGSDSEAIMLSAKFHVGIAQIADQQVLTELVRDLVSRSSLVIALYWKRRETTCEQNAHDALVDALGAGDNARASALMTAHLGDLVTGLDLSGVEPAPESLSSILG